MGGYWLFVIGMLVFGGLFAAVGFSIERGQRELARTGVAVNVEVIQMHRRSDSDGTTYAPEFEITSGIHEGKRWESKFSSNPPTHSVGDKSKGFYDPESGNIQSREANKNGFMFSLIFSSVGLGIMISGLIFWIRATNF